MSTGPQVADWLSVHLPASLSLFAGTAPHRSLSRCTNSCPQHFEYVTISLYFFDALRTALVGWKDLNDDSILTMESAMSRKQSLSSYCQRITNKVYKIYKNKQMYYIISI